MDDFIDHFEDTLPCRRSQAEQILNFIGEKDESLPPCLFLYGSTATGKTVCISTVLKHLNYRYVVVNAVECYSQKILYETILNELVGHVYNSTNKFTPLYKCDNMKDFIIILNNIFGSNDNYEPVIIVIDKAERLRDLEHNILPVFLRLNEFCKFNICSILISNVIFEKYYTKTGLKEPLKIFFPQYTKEELFKIIMSNRSECANYVLRKYPINTASANNVQRSDVFANYLNAFLSVFYRSCRDLVELKYMARINYVKYCEPILDGTINADDVTKLWRNIGPILKSNLEVLYLRLNSNKNKHSDEQMAVNMLNLDINKGDSEKTLTDELTSMKTYAQNFELPFYAKYLLIAAYLASFNPAKEDKRLFMKNHGKQRKRMQQVNAEAKINEKLNTQIGPKPFALDRLLAIFYAILDERVGLTANMLVQISSLVNLHLLSTSPDATKYKCTVSYEFISVISRTVGFNIKKYLYDFI